MIPESLGSAESAVGTEHDLSPLVYIRKRACCAFFGMHAFGAAFQSLVAVSLAVPLGPSQT